MSILMLKHGVVYEQSVTGTLVQIKEAVQPSLLTCELKSPSMAMESPTGVPCRTPFMVSRKTELKDRPQLIDDGVIFAGIFTQQRCFLKSEEYDV